VSFCLVILRVECGGLKKIEKGKVEGGGDVWGGEKEETKITSLF